MLKTVSIGKERFDYRFISSSGDDAELAAAIDELEAQAGPVALDTETTGLNPVSERVRLIQIAVGRLAIVVDLDGYRDYPKGRVIASRFTGLYKLYNLLSGTRGKVLQNATFDLGFLWYENFRVNGNIFDTMIAAKIVNNGTNAKNDLGSITERELGLELPKDLQKADWSGELDEEKLEYSVRDALILLKLVKPLKEKLQGAVVLTTNISLWSVFQLEMQALRGVAHMQIHGFRFDLPRARGLRKELEVESEAAKQAFLEMLDGEIQRRHPDDPSTWLPRDPDGSYNTREKDSGSIRLGTKKKAGFNPRSPKQMAEAFEKAGIILPPDAKGNTSLDQNLLAFIKKQYRLVELYLEYKESVTKVSALQTLLDNVSKETGRIHGSYRQVGTETGRLSAAKPNLQQIPRSERFRSLFIADEGYKLIVADFSQVELRVAAELSGEPRMVEAYQAGRDLHTETAALMTGVSHDQVTKSARQSAKVANFGLLYGAGPATLRKQAVAQYGLDMSLSEAKEIVEGFRSAYPTLYKWQTKEGNKTTPCVFTAYGRRRILVNFNDKYTTRINSQVQGTAGDIAKIAITKLWDEIVVSPEDEVRLIACCHDELVLEAREDAASKWEQRLKACMEAAGSVVCRHVPIVAEASSGLTWAEAK